ncbi:carbohydrate ABC transporter permease [Atribacter laminatus]|jgi:multiple sugar transport system permease protein|uniref:Trehalose transport system permease protein SugB n=1 Tax=Atribacter laminatus TaxID=2847778 RepID=A0A7T1AKA8_ATRLM|nr:carbohydrate ABC transporter permease [Atribacter laminatus]QPM67483.1 Trehalose transport system permease protein SugB [Atribacter laminatus]
MKVRQARSLRRFLKYLFLAVVAFIGLIPFILIVLTSIKTTVDALAMPPKWFFTPTLQNYQKLITSIDFLKSIKNSLIIGVGATIAATGLGITTSYTLTRFHFKGDKAFSYFILALRIVPPITFVIPYFLIWRSLKLADTYFSMITMYVTLVLPLLIWMIRSFFAEIPYEIEEAAMVDGCTRWQTLRYVLIPTVIPGIMASATLSFIFVWNEFMFALLNTGRNTRTLPIEIYNSLGYYQLDWAKLSSSAVIAIIPVIIIIALTQKYIIRGLTMGAVKG